MNRGPNKSLPKWASSPPKYEGPQAPPSMDIDEDIEDVVGFLIGSTYICKFIVLMIYLSLKEHGNENWSNDVVEEPPEGSAP